MSKLSTKKSILITGGCGFIGSHLLRLFVNKYPDYKIINLDKLTYAGDLDKVSDLEGKENYLFIQGDICDHELVKNVFTINDITHVIHLAAESHVDRSIENSSDFIQTNILGTINLLNVAKACWQDGAGREEKVEDKVEARLRSCGASVSKIERKHLFYHISTDEVYGALGSDGFFTEESPYDPKSPYSASKASSDHFVRAYANTYGLPIMISNCSNNYGPAQYPEKLIPLIIENIIDSKPLPIYGKGENIRDWLYVEDHVHAIDMLFHEGQTGNTYNIGGNNEWSNIDLVKLICRKMDIILKRPQGSSEALIQFVSDRPGHDMRYAIDASKLKALGWTPKMRFEEGIEKTIVYYIDKY